MKNYTYVRKTFTFDGKRYEVRGSSLEEAIENMVILKQQLQTGQVIICSSMSVNNWAKEAASTYKQDLSNDWQKSFNSIMNKHVLSEIGHMKLKDVLPLHCQKLMNNLEGKSNSLIDKTYQCINFIFSTAKSNKLIIDNPAESIKKPVGYNNPRRSLTDFERRILLCVADCHRAGPWVLSMLYCGLRPSETALIKYGDIIFCDGIRCLQVNGTKTKAARRVVPLQNYVYDRLPVTDPYGYIFTTFSGKQLNTTAMKRMWHSFKRDMQIAAGCKVYRNALVPPYPIDPALTPYYLRHTYCTDLQNAGVDVRIAQKLMGHSRIEVTAGIYSHNDTTALSCAASAAEAHRSALEKKIKTEVSS